MREIIVGSRKSKLALIQTNWVINELKKQPNAPQFHIKEIATKGDKNLQVSLAKFGGQGVFLEELEEQLLNGYVDMAVHSLKDMPTQLKEGLTIACIPKREDHRDAYIAKGHVPFSELPKGSVIGTSSVRRAAQLLQKRPDVITKWIRGPIDSRLEQLATGHFDAIILAVAGMKRLNIAEGNITEYLSDEHFIPAMGQGALAIECRKDDTEIKKLLATIHDEDANKAVTTERLFLDAFHEGEQAPIGGYAYVTNDLIHLRGMVISLDGQTIIQHEATGEIPKVLAEEVANHLIERGAMDIIQEVNKELSYDDFSTR
ncbi:MAG TPA: hydroxymethylbilane synthase [Virgibacillus sp.]|nr:hydroxymethylbilane synthase [Virgibacillus sp.]